MATFPGGVHNFADNPVQNNVDIVDETHANEAWDEIVAIETELGVNPRGGEASVAARLTNIENTTASSGHNHNSAYIDKTLYNSKGDLLVASANDTPFTLTAGTNGQVLTANSGQTGGMHWVTPTHVDIGTGDPHTQYLLKSGGTMTGALYTASTGIFLGGNDHIWHDDGSNRYHFVSDNSGNVTGNATLYAAGGVFNGGTVWHGNNDGAGSGLDADTVDGSHASAFAAASHSHAGSNIGARAFGQSALIDSITQLTSGSPSRGFTLTCTHGWTGANYDILVNWSVMYENRDEAGGDAGGHDARVTITTNGLVSTIHRHEVPGKGAVNSRWQTVSGSHHKLGNTTNTSFNVTISCETSPGGWVHMWVKDIIVNVIAVRNS